MTAGRPPETPGAVPRGAGPGSPGPQLSGRGSAGEEPGTACPIPGAAAGPGGSAPAVRSRPSSSTGRSALVLGALGVVYGDIGTSPLYAMETVFSVDGGAVRATPADVLGVASLVFWSLTLTVSVKYVALVLRADNDGEGGVLALAALVRRSLGRPASRRAAVVLGLGVLGASLFYGDSVITPAISVLSAVEGLELVSPSLSRWVLPVAAVVLTALFAVQRWGTGGVGRVFGPVMLIWFFALGAVGLAGVVDRPSVLRGLSPTYAVAFWLDRPATAFVATGAVVLAVTGAEALYADMGHFGRRPIRRAWFLVVFPALTLNYLGQAALVERDPSARDGLFYLLVPAWALVPMVVLATAATVIASQAVISGAFSVSHQAVQLGLLPRMRVVHTSSEEAGQVYVPAVGGALFVAVLAVMIGFGSSASLAGAYGVAVTATFTITTVLLLAVARERWGWPTGRLVLLGGLLGVLESTYLAANLTKVAHGGWLTLLIAATVFTVMTTWRRGRELLVARRTEAEGSLGEVVAEVGTADLPRVAGTAVYPHPTGATAPLALRATIDRFSVVHRCVVVMTGRTAAVPHVPWEERLTVEPLGDPADGFVHVSVAFGFRDPTDFPEALRRALGPSAPDTATWFLSRLTVLRTRRPGMSAWRKRLFIALERGAADHGDHLRLPGARTVGMGADLEI